MRQSHFPHRAAPREIIVEHGDCSVSEGLNSCTALKNANKSNSESELGFVSEWVKSVLSLSPMADAGVLTGEIGP